MRHFTSLLVLIIFTLTACNKPSQDVAELKPATTSHEALVRIVDALANRDEQAIVALVDGGADAQEFFRSIVASFKAADDFREKFSQVYGKEAWIAFQAPAALSHHRPDMQLVLPDFDKMRKSLADWQTTAENEGSFELLPRVLLKFKKVKGGWVINGSELFTDRATLREVTKTQNALAAFIRKYMKAIGHEQISAEDIDYQMGKNMLREIMGGELISKGKPALPDRFNIEIIKAESDGAATGRTPSRSGPIPNPPAVGSGR